MQEPEIDEEFASLGNPFAFNLHNILWLTGAAVVTAAIVALKVMGMIR
jgi:hypothetical protein